MSEMPPVLDASSHANRPPRFLCDANFNLHIVAGLRRQRPAMDIVTAKQANLLQAPDPDVLLYAMAQNRILLTHDRKTMPSHFDDLLRTLSTTEHSPGVMTVEQLLPIGTAIDAILVVWECSTHDEWRDQFVYLPL